MSWMGLKTDKQMNKVISESNMCYGESKLGKDKLESNLEEIGGRHVRLGGQGDVYWRGHLT